MRCSLRGRTTRVLFAWLWIVYMSHSKVAVGSRGTTLSARMSKGPIRCADILRSTEGKLEANGLSRQLLQIPVEEEEDLINSEAVFSDTDGSDLEELAYEEESVAEEEENEPRDGGTTVFSGQEDVDAEFKDIQEQSLGKDSEEDYADITQPDTSDFPSQEDASETGMVAMGKQAGSSEVWHFVDSLSSDATSSHVARPPKYMRAVQTVEPLTLPKDVEDALQRGIDAHVAAGPLPQPKNTTSRKVTPLTEKSSQATDTEEETLETLQDLQNPIGESSLDSSLAAEKAIEEARLDETEQEQSALAGVSSSGQSDGSSSGEVAPDIEAALGEELSSAKGAAEDGSASIQEESSSEESRDSSLVTQGAIISSTISGMVSDNSSGITGVIAVVVTVVAGFGVACAGISIYRRFKGRKDGRPSPRIIEITSLAQSSKSPTYSRVGAQNQDMEGGSGADWQDFDKWEKPQQSSSISKATAVKQKKAWDWDADW